MVELHEDILGELHRVVPDSEYTQNDGPPAIPASNGLGHPKSSAHRRWKSLDAVPEDDASILWHQDEPGLLADPQIAADVARIFGRRVGVVRFHEINEFTHRLPTDEPVLHI